MAKKDDIFGSPKAMHNYYCFCTHQYIQAQLIFVLMVQEFKKKPEAGKAQLISKWFLEKDIDSELSKNGFIDELNIPNKVASAIPDMKNAANSNNTPKEDLFDILYDSVMVDVLNGKTQTLSYEHLSNSIFNKIALKGNNYDGGVYNSGLIYMPNGKFSGQMQWLRLWLRAGSFKPDAMGLW